MACKIITFGPIIKLVVSNESPTISFPQTYPYLHMVSRTQMSDDVSSKETFMRYPVGKVSLAAEAGSQIVSKVR